MIGTAWPEGGVETVTVTDLNLILGRLNADYFLGGRLTIHPDRARAAIERDVARPMGIDVPAAARAIIDIANARMVAALQLVSIRRGIDPRDYALVASGGSGPVHVMDIAAALDIGTVIIPPTPGLNSAVGLLATDIKQEIVRAVTTPTADLGESAFAEIVAEMDAQARELLLGEAVQRASMDVLAEADVCYLGQNYPLRITIPRERQGMLDAVDHAFRAEHRRHYGFASDTEPTVILNLRFTAIGHVERPHLKPLEDGGTDPAAALKGHREVTFATPVRTPIYDRARLLAGNVITGPAIIEQMDTTVLLPRHTAARVDRSGTLVATTRAMP
jgi:N-methylhydantoinase A